MNRVLDNLFRSPSYAGGGSLDGVDLGKRWYDKDLAMLSRAGLTKEQYDRLMDQAKVSAISRKMILAKDRVAVDQKPPRILQADASKIRETFLKQHTKDALVTTNSQVQKYGEQNVKDSGYFSRLKKLMSNPAKLKQALAGSFNKGEKFSGRPIFDKAFKDLGSQTGLIYSGVSHNLKFIEELNKIGKTFDAYRANVQSGRERGGVDWSKIAPMMGRISKTPKINNDNALSGVGPMLGRMGGRSTANNIPNIQGLLPRVLPKARSISKNTTSYPQLLSGFSESRTSKPYSIVDKIKSFIPRKLSQYLTKDNLLDAAMGIGGTAGLLGIGSLIGSIPMFKEGGDYNISHFPAGMKKYDQELANALYKKSTSIDTSNNAGTMTWSAMEALKERLEKGDVSSGLFVAHDPKTMDIMGALDYSKLDRGRVNMTHVGSTVSGKGIGTDLINNLVGYAKDSGMKSLEWQSLNDESTSFYKKKFPSAKQLTAWDFKMPLFASGGDPFKPYTPTVHSFNQFAEILKRGGSLNGTFSTEQIKNILEKKKFAGGGPLSRADALNFYTGPGYGDLTQYMLHPRKASAMFSTEQIGTMDDVIKRLKFETGKPLGDDNSPALYSGMNETKNKLYFNQLKNPKLEAVKFKPFMSATPDINIAKGFADDQNILKIFNTSSLWGTAIQPEESFQPTDEKEILLHPGLNVRPVDAPYRDRNYTVHPVEPWYPKHGISGNFSYDQLMKDPDFSKLLGNKFAKGGSIYSSKDIPMLSGLLSPDIQEHVQSMHDITDTIFSQIPKTKLNKSLLDKAIDLHDITKESVDDKNHGNYASKFIKQSGILNDLGKKKEDIISFLVDKHSGVRMPKLAGFGDNSKKQVQGLLPILRIADTLSKGEFNRFPVVIGKNGKMKLTQDVGGLSKQKMQRLKTSINAYNKYAKGYAGGGNPLTGYSKIPFTLPQNDLDLKFNKGYYKNQNERTKSESYPSLGISNLLNFINGKDTGYGISNFPEGMVENLTKGVDQRFPFELAKILDLSPVDIKFRKLGMIGTGNYDARRDNIELSSSANQEVLLHEFLHARGQRGMLKALKNTGFTPETFIQSFDPNEFTKYGRTYFDGINSKIGPQYSGAKWTGSTKYNIGNALSEDFAEIFSKGIKPESVGIAKEHKSLGIKNPLIKYIDALGLANGGQLLSNPIKVSNGEIGIPRGMVDKIGLGTLHSLNAGNIDGAFGKFSGGGSSSAFTFNGPGTGTSDSILTDADRGMKGPSSDDIGFIIKASSSKKIRDVMNGGGGSVKGFANGGDIDDATYKDRIRSKNSEVLVNINAGNIKETGNNPSIEYIRKAFEQFKGTPYLGKQTMWRGVNEGLGSIQEFKDIKDLLRQIFESKGFNWGVGKGGKQNTPQYLNYEIKASKAVTEAMNKIYKSYDVKEVTNLQEDLARQDIGVRKLTDLNEKEREQISKNIVSEKDSNKVLKDLQKAAKEQIEEMKKSKAGVYRGNVRYQEHGPLGYNDLRDIGTNVPSRTELVSEPYFPGEKRREPLSSRFIQGTRGVLESLRQEIFEPTRQQFGYKAAVNIPIMSEGTKTTKQQEFLDRNFKEFMNFEDTFYNNLEDVFGKYLGNLGIRDVVKINQYTKEGVQQVPLGVVDMPKRVVKGEKTAKTESGRTVVDTENTVISKPELVTDSRKITSGVIEVEFIPNQKILQHFNVNPAEVFNQLIQNALPSTEAMGGLTEKMSETFAGKNELGGEDEKRKDLIAKTLGKKDDVETIKKATIQAGIFSDQVKKIGMNQTALYKISDIFRGLSWRFASLSMSAMGVYFSIQGLLMSFTSGLNSIITPLTDIEGLMKNIGMSTAFGAGIMNATTALDTMKVSTNDLISSYENLTNIQGTIQTLFASLGAKVFGGEKGKQFADELLTGISKAFQELDAGGISETIKDLLKAVVEAIPAILPAIKAVTSMLETLAKNKALVSLAAQLMVISLVIQPITSGFSAVLTMVGGFALFGNLFVTISKALWGVAIASEASAVGFTKMGLAMRAMSAGTVLIGFLALYEVVANLVNMLNVFGDFKLPTITGTLLNGITQGFANGGVVKSEGYDQVPGSPDDTIITAKAGEVVADPKKRKKLQGFADAPSGILAGPSASTNPAENTWNQSQINGFLGKSADYTGVTSKVLTNVQESNTLAVTVKNWPETWGNEGNSNQTEFQLPFDLGIPELYQLISGKYPSNADKDKSKLLDKDKDRDKDKSKDKNKEMMEKVKEWERDKDKSKDKDKDKDKDRDKDRNKDKSISERIKDIFDKATKSIDVKSIEDLKSLSNKELSKYGYSKDASGNFLKLEQNPFQTFTEKIKRTNSKYIRQVSPEDALSDVKSMQSSKTSIPSMSSKLTLDNLKSVWSGKYNDTGWGIKHGVIPNWYDFLVTLSESAKEGPEQAPYSLASTMAGVTGVAAGLGASSWGGKKLIKSGGTLVYKPGQDKVSMAMDRMFGEGPGGESSSLETKLVSKGGISNAAKLYSGKILYSGANVVSKALQKVAELTIPISEVQSAAANINFNENRKKSGSYDYNYFKNLSEKYSGDKIGATGYAMEFLTAGSSGFNFQNAYMKRKLQENQYYYGNDTSHLANYLDTENKQMGGGMQGVAHAAIGAGYATQDIIDYWFNDAATNWMNTAPLFKYMRGSTGELPSFQKEHYDWSNLPSDTEKSINKTASNPWTFLTPLLSNIIPGGSALFPLASAASITNADETTTGLDNLNTSLSGLNGTVDTTNLKFVGVTNELDKMSAINQITQPSVTNQPESNLNNANNWQYVGKGSPSELYNQAMNNKQSAIPTTGWEWGWNNTPKSQETLTSQLLKDYINQASTTLNNGATPNMEVLTPSGSAWWKQGSLANGKITYYEDPNGNKYSFGGSSEAASVAQSPAAGIVNNGQQQQSSTATTTTTQPITVQITVSGEELATKGYVEKTINVEIPRTVDNILKQTATTTRAR
jgi:predicted GNAT family acetyltransferase